MSTKCNGKRKYFNSGKCFWKYHQPERNHYWDITRVFQIASNSMVCYRKSPMSDRFPQRSSSENDDFMP